MKKILSLIIILTISLNCFSQQSAAICHGNECEEECKCPLGYAINEVSKLKHIKNQFYKNEAGHLYIRTGSVRPGENGQLVEKLFFSSLVSQNIDVATYTAFDSGVWYGKDKNHIYFTKGNSDGDHIWELENADVKTFKTLNTIYNTYAIDANHIYYNDEILEGFNPNKTKFIKNKKGLIIAFLQGKKRHKIE